ncbi:heat-inducible transcriptional repressor HrcA [Mycoplasma phocoenae]|uniref:Heat-inducible transcription repressor HrcA n=1 Tax=Mycoplasma phocoenae TaxID=754517 RepID=A0A858U973_9MOLU|nr:heat-inducible transcriptional repressor HrcA [Mycoplasma phocoenae]QJG67246.1 heat-inducible transcriptional repressor HrcA [Mycoplasma phocoenae]
MKELKIKDEDLLKKIVETYIETGQPVGSKYLCQRYSMKCSPATIRSRMVLLEEAGYIEKNHTSSGRIPSINGLEYYTKKLVYNPKKYLQEKLEDALARRRLSIDTTIEQAASVISEVAGLTLVTTSDNSDEVLKSISLTVLSETSAIIVLVSSSGRVESKMFTFDSSKIAIDDVRIAVRLFKDRLIDTPLVDLRMKAMALNPIFATQVKNYELLIQEFIRSVFIFEEEHVSHVYNKNQIILSRDITREGITDVLDFIENQSVWAALEHDLDDECSIKFDLNRPNISLISKKIDFRNSKNIKEVTVVGSNRMDYDKAFEALTTMEKLLKETAKE